MSSGALVAPTPSALELVREAECMLRGLPQTEIPVDHLIHAGMYARTVSIPAEMVISGALITRATILILSGDATVFTGADAVRLTGFHVIAGSAGRKQLYRTHARTHLTMLFPSRAQSVAEVEREFTSEPDLLMNNPDLDTVTFTGE